VDIALNSAELRVLGSLIEKESTTPEYYPLTLNALAAACSQKSNRWPVAEYNEPEILQALEALRARGYAAEIIGSGRVPKYAQRFTAKLNMGRRETAILCILMLRGQQTLGEIRNRAERLYDFGDLDEVEMVMQKLIDRSEGALVQKLPPAPGMKEPRYAQTLGGVAERAEAHAPSPVPSVADRMAALESEVSQLRAEVAELKRRPDEVL
jgi:uncharacterized protein